MDYVVFGTGYGATLMLLGWALRTFGPSLRYQDPDQNVDHGIEFSVARTSWRRFAAALGAVVTTAGAVFVVVTFALILINPGNSMGAIIAWISFGLILLAVAAWAWVYVGRYGIYGILPVPRQGIEVVRASDNIAQRERRALHMQRNSTSEADVVERVPADDADDVDSDEAYDDLGAPASYDPGEDEWEARYAKYQQHHPEAVDGSEYATVAPDQIGSLDIDETGKAAQAGQSPPEKQAVSDGWVTATAEDSHTDHTGPTLAGEHLADNDRADAEAAGGDEQAQSAADASIASRHTEEDAGEGDHRLVESRSDDSVEEEES